MRYLPLEPDHIESRGARARKDQQVPPKLRMRMNRGGPREHHGHGSRHAEHETRDLRPCKPVDPQCHREQQHQQRNDGVDDRAVDRRGFRQSVHEKHLAQHADQQRGADQPADIRPFDPLRPLPKQRDQRQQRRSDQRSRDHGHRMHVIRQHDIVKGIIQGPDHVARQKGQMRFQAVHAFRVSLRKAKTMPADVSVRPGDAERAGIPSPAKAPSRRAVPETARQDTASPRQDVIPFRQDTAPPRRHGERKAGNRARRDTQDRKREFRDRPCGQRIADK